MNCMKCGREVPGDQCFCDQCRAGMEKYPVKSGIAIQLPKRRESPMFKMMPARRRITPEEQVKKLQWTVTVLSVLLVASALTIGFLLYPMVKPLLEEEKPKPGQNYSTMESTGTVPTE